ncbi:MAG: hypothetical protein JEZ06_21285 [Anaerolineaceae bacterium]|nr:hypothetical protein [Anaerolineaceae bacterium]
MMSRKIQKLFLLDELKGLQLGGFIQSERENVPSTDFISVKVGEVDGEFI